MREPCMRVLGLVSLVIMAAPGAVGTRAQEDWGGDGAEAGWDDETDDGAGAVPTAFDDGGDAGDGGDGASLGDASGADALRRGATIQLGSGVPREVPPSHVVRRGETLWDITGRYFGNPWMWPRVWSYNPEVTNPHWIYPDGVLRLRPGAGAADVADARLPGDAADDGGSLAARVAARRAPEAVLLREEGFVDRESLEAAGRIVGSPEEHMMLSTYDEVYVRFDEGEVAPGQELVVFRRVDRDERIPGETGELVRLLGAVRIRSFDADRRVATAIIVDALDPIERGFLVADIPRRFELVAPTRNEADVRARVVATLRPRLLLGEYQVLFVDAGAEEGVRLGNRMFVIRAADEWRESLFSGEDRFAATSPDTPRLRNPPPEVIAEARVVDVKPHHAGLMVTNATRPVVIGDVVEMREGY